MMIDTRTTLRTVLIAGTIVTVAAPVMSQELNLYSSRHYDTDERLYSNFEE